MGCCALQESYRLLSPLNLVAVCFLPSLETSRSVTVFPEVGTKSALSAGPGCWGNKWMDGWHKESPLDNIPSPTSIS